MSQCLQVFTSPHGGHSDCGLPVGYHGETASAIDGSHRNSAERNGHVNSNSSSRNDRNRSNSDYNGSHHHHPRPTPPPPSPPRPCHIVHDLTIAYRDHTDGIRTTDTGIAYRGQFPREVHIRIERHDLSTLPTEKRALEQWLRSSYERKDALLKLFYEGK